MKRKGSRMARRTLRNTRQRAEVVTALAASDGFLSAQDLHSKIRTTRGGVGLTTVYRTLSALADAGRVHVIRSESGEALFGRCTAADVHHHHLRCRGCGRAVELSNEGFEEWVKSLGERHGFTELTHECEIHGVCSECSHSRTGNPHGTIRGT